MSTQENARLLSEIVEIKSDPDENAVDVYCATCNKNLTSGESIFHNVLYHGYFNCQFCSALYKHKKEKDEHEWKNHFPVKCKRCDSEYKCSRTLKNHCDDIHHLKQCDFCDEDLIPKDLYFNHLSSHHNIKGNIHFNELFDTYFVLKIIDRYNFCCNLCYEIHNLQSIYSHFTTEHNFTVNQLVGVIHKMKIITYLKYEVEDIKVSTKIYEISSLCNAANVSNGNVDLKLTLQTCNNSYDNQLSQEYVVSNLPINAASSTSSDFCDSCKLQYSDEAPKSLHEIYCFGLYRCNTCNEAFNSNTMRTSHINSHEAVCPLGCKNVAVTAGTINDHCVEMHNIAKCKYCEFYVSDCNGLLNSHLETIHKYNLKTNDYNTNKLFLLDKNKCLLCGDVLLFVDNLEEIVNHFCRYHNMQFQIFENLLMKKYVDEFDLNRGFNDIKNDDENIMLNCNEINRTSESGMIIYDDEITICENESENINNEISIKLEENNTELDMNGFRDVNYSEIQCVVSDTSDEDISDNEKEIEYEPDSSLNNTLERTCDICTCVFDKKDLYVKHLARLHGLKLKPCKLDDKIKMEENGIDVSGTDNVNDENDILPIVSKYIKMINNFQNVSMFLCLICDMEIESKSAARRHFRTHDIWSSSKCDSIELGYKCRFCSNLFWSIEKRNRHQVVRHLTVEARPLFMKCYECTAIYSSRTCLFRHFRSAHSKTISFRSISYKCLHCCKLFPNLSLIREHFSNDHPRSFSLYCSVSHCRTKCNTKKNLRQHYKRLHKPDRQPDIPKTCKLCNKTLKNNRSFILHMRMKHDRIARLGFKCRLCEERFNTAIERKQHTNVQHPGLPTFFCKLCDKSFHSKSGLSGHVQTHKQRVHECPYCKKTFNRRDSYMEHKLIHIGPRHKCLQCDKEFVQKSNLIRHVRTHTGDKPYSCRYCLKTFADKGACNSHERVHTREEVSACPYCGQSFSKKQKLKYHIRKHTGEGLEVCTICDKIFTNGYSLKKHQEIHDRDTQYLCECGKAFSSEVYLHRHAINTHGHPDAPKAFKFQCSVCQKGYNSQSKLKDHLMTHSTEKHIKCLLCSFACQTKKTVRRHLTKKHLIPESQHLSCFTVLTPLQAGAPLLQSITDVDDKSTVQAEILLQQMTQPLNLTELIQKDYDYHNSANNEEGSVQDMTCTTVKIEILDDD